MAGIIVKSVAIYFIFNLLRNLNDIVGYLCATFSLEFLFKLLIFNDPGPNLGGHMWYMFSLLYSVTAFYLLYRKKFNNLMIGLSLIGVITLLLAGKYSILIFEYDMPTYFTKNWFTVGFPFLFLGYSLNYYKEILLKKINVISNIIVIIFSFILCCFERYMLLDLGAYAKRDFYIGTIFLTFFILLLAVRYPYFGKGTMFEYIGRELSTGVYIIHLLIIPFVLKVLNLLPVEHSIIELLFRFNFIIVFCISVLCTYLWKVIAMNCRRARVTAREK